MRFSQFSTRFLAAAETCDQITLLFGMGSQGIQKGKDGFLGKWYYVLILVLRANGSKAEKNELITKV